MHGKLFAAVLTVAMAASSSMAFASSGYAPHFEPMKPSSRAPSPQTSRSSTTGTGATLGWSWSMQQTHGGADRSNEYADEFSFDLSYRDSTRYFGNASTVMATITVTTRVDHHGGYPDKPLSTTFEIPLDSTNDGVFVGAFKAVLPGYIADSQMNIDSVAVAFHAGDKWDSNFGANYDLGRY